MTPPHDHSGPASPEERPFVDDGVADGPPESLVLDIGGDVGALVLYAHEECLGQEIDLSPVGTSRSHHTHTMIRRRRAVNRQFIAGVYPELHQGTYTIWSLDGEAMADVTITGGTVTEYDAGNCRTS